MTAGQWYRVTFDAATSQANQPINLLVRRGGGGSANYEPLMPGGETFAGATTWRRYSFQFQATKTVVANSPATGELGARVDFERVQPGTLLTVARLEMVPLTPATAALNVRLLTNPSRSAALANCPTADAAAGLCAQFYAFSDNAPIAWPTPVPMLSGKAIYTRDTSLTDADGDGVADQQDTCPGTPAGTAVNARGCGIGQ